MMRSIVFFNIHERIFNNGLRVVEIAEITSLKKISYVDQQPFFFLLRRWNVFSILHSLLLCAPISLEKIVKYLFRGAQHYIYSNHDNSALAKITKFIILKNIVFEY